MAIDIRAVVTCSLGDLISGSISDDYIQSNGLVKTKGSVELKGVLTPVVGTAVSFSYSRDGISTTVPRKLRVLSSFADPFRQVTKVELGCMLVYKADVTPAPTVDGLAAETSGRQQQCLNGYSDYPSNSVVTIPVNAAGVMQTCLTKLGITASGIPLTNRFNTEKFDLSAGYVQVLADLLYSESFIGYLDGNEVLQVRNLIAEGGKGPVIDTTNLIDLDAIGVGGLPGEAVVVRYNSLKLSGDVDVADQAGDKKRNWEEEEVAGSPQNVEVRYTTAAGDSASSVFTFVPHSITETTYGADASWNDTTCVISSSRGEGADLSNSVISRKTTQRTILAEAANSYCAQLLSAGLPNVGGIEGAITRSESYQYDSKGELVEQISEVYEPFFKWAGGLGVDFVYDGNYVVLGSKNVLVERTIIAYSNIYAEQLGSVFLKPGETHERAVEGQKVTTTVYKNWALTVGGQQGAASIKELAPFGTVGALSAWLDYASAVLVMVDSQVRTQAGRGGVAGQVRPSRALRTGQATGTTVEGTARLAYAMGSASAERFVSFSMPYQSDDVHTSAGVIVKGDAEAKALRFGRIQNRLLLGNRNGVNLQVHPSKMPAAPFDPLYLSDGSLMVQYRANAINWAFGRDGIVCSVDALFWGVAGGTGTAWVPVAPGIATFPPLPVVDAGGDSTVDAVVPPWNEIVPLRGITRTLLVARDYDYAIGVIAEAASLVTHTRVAVGYYLAADAGSFVLTGTAQPIKLRAGVGAFVLNGLPAGSIGNRVWRVNGAIFNVVGQDATKRRTYAALAAEAGSFVFDGQVAGKFKGTAIHADGTTFLVTGADAGSRLGRSLAAGAGNYLVGGMSAGLAHKAPIIYQFNIPILDSYSNVNSNGKWFVNGTAPSFYKADASGLNSGLTLSAAKAGQVVGVSTDGINFTDKTLNLDVVDIFSNGNVFRLNWNAPPSLSGGSVWLRFQGIVKPPIAAVLGYTGSAAARSVAGAGFKPGFVMLYRADAQSERIILDKRRGPTFGFSYHDSVAQSTDAAGLTSFNNDGFGLGAGPINNGAGLAYAAITIKEPGASTANTSGTIASNVNADDSLGLSIFSYTGNGVTGSTVGHGLAGIPQVVFIKNYLSTGSFMVIGSPLMGVNTYLRSSSTAAAFTEATSFQAFGASTLTLGNFVSLNTSGQSYVGYAFRNTDSIKTGVINGAGASTLSVSLGFRPSLVFAKTYAGGGNHLWYYRPSAGDGFAQVLASDSTTAVPGASSTVQILSTGFSVASGGIGNVSGGTARAIYIAFR